MKKIDKSVILSTQYREWLEELNKSNKPHPSGDTYKCDVVMNLLYKSLRARQSFRSSVSFWRKETDVRFSSNGRTFFKRFLRRSLEGRRRGRTGGQRPRPIKEKKFTWHLFFLIGGEKFACPQPGQAGTKKDCLVREITNYKSQITNKSQSQNYKSQKKLRPSDRFLNAFGEEYKTTVLILKSSGKFFGL